MEVSGRVRIEAPVEEVFAYVDDWRNTTRYLSGLHRWEPVDPANAQGLGARFRASIKVGPVTLTGEMEVTEHVPGRRVAFRSVSGPRLEGQWDFRREDGATVIELRNEFEVPGGMAGRMVERFVRSQGQKDLEASLRRLKEQVEALG